MGAKKNNRISTSCDNNPGPSQDDIQFRLWIKMYDECQSQRRHHEMARANLSICIITANTAIFGFAVQGYLNGIYACAMIMFLSLIGFLSVMAYSERYNFYWRRSQCIRKHLNHTYMGDQINSRLKEAKDYRADEEDEKKCPNRWPRCINHHNIWKITHVAIFAIGLVALIVILAQPRTCSHSERSMVINNPTFVNDSN